MFAAVSPSRCYGFWKDAQPFVGEEYDYEIRWNACARTGKTFTDMISLPFAVLGLINPFQTHRMIKTVKEDYHRGLAYDEFLDAVSVCFCNGGLWSVVDMFTLPIGVLSACFPTRTYYFFMSLPYVYRDSCTQVRKGWVIGIVVGLIDVFFLVPLFLLVVLFCWRLPPVLAAWSKSCAAYCKRDKKIALDLEQDLAYDVVPRKVLMRQAMLALCDLLAVPLFVVLFVSAVRFKPVFR